MCTEDDMRKCWALGAMAGFLVTMTGAAAAQQTATRPKPQKPAVTKEAKAEKEDDERAENEGAKKYKIAAELPAPVTAAFKQSYPNATIRGTAKEMENGKAVYEVESLDNGRARDLLYSADGQALEIEEELSPVDLPAPVTAALKKMYPAATIAVAEKVTKGAAVRFDLQLREATKKEVSFLPDGTVPKPAGK